MTFEGKRILEENLIAVSAVDPPLARVISESVSDSRIVFLSARDGSVIPAFEAGGNILPFHSLFDPLRESRRQFAPQRGAGYIVFFGLGAGYHIAPFLEDPLVAQVLIIEKSAPVLKALLEKVPLRGLLTDRRVRILAAPAAGAIESHILSTYVPAIDGDLRSIPLRPWCEREPRFFGAAAEEVRSSIAKSRADYSAQAHFGKRWFGNILLNLPAAESAAIEVHPASVAHVAAAGPSLDAQARSLAVRDKNSRLIATDTSLPALLRSGILPDAVVSIDCQQYCYLHFLPGMPQGVPLFLDLASPPLLARRARRSAFFASGHPLARYLSKHWKAFPPIDTSGGNVAHAGISLARSLGAATIHVYGADFSYPDGKPYARGTYLFDLFASRETRCAPLESCFFSFILRSDGVEKERIGDGWRYTTPVLLGYRKNLIAALQVLDTLIILAEGKGLSLETGLEGQGKARASGGREVSFEWRPGKPRCGWREFLSSYADELRGLPVPGEPLRKYFTELSPAHKELWATLLPLAPALLKEAGSGLPRADALQEARGWALGRISRALQPSAE